MRLAISFKLSNWLMDSTESSGACDGCDRWEKHEFFLRTDHLCYAGGTDGLSLWGTSMCDVHMTLFVMFNPLLQEVINCKFPTKLCQSSSLSHIQSKCGRCISVEPTQSRRILHLCPITRAKNDNKVSGIYLVDGGEDAAAGEMTRHSPHRR